LPTAPDRALAGAPGGTLFWNLNKGQGSARGATRLGILAALQNLSIGERKTFAADFLIRLSLIGMSGAGKSHWTRKLAGAGFRAIDVDDRIERKLAPELSADGHRGIGGVAAWMGWPDQPEYREREHKYLASEIESMCEVLDEVEASGEDGIVLDTTGSVVYTGEEICRRMQRLTTVVYLEASPDEELTLISRYMSDPKPVLWGDIFSQQSGELAGETVARCYPQLIAHRKQLYERYANVTVPMARLRDTSPDARGFLEILNSQARPAR
jgi:shikimate kinase